MNLGVSVDMVKAATEMASLVIAQVNARLPRVHGDGFIHIRTWISLFRMMSPSWSIVQRQTTRLLSGSENMFRGL